MTYARIEDGTIAEYPVFEGDIKSRFPNVSFTIPFVPPSDYEKVELTETPIVNYTEEVSEGTPQFIDGGLKQTWVVQQASPEIIGQRTTAQAESIRYERNNRLANCDWTQLPDAPVDKAAWAAYRQQLRDISSQEGFPWTIIWPDQP